MYLYKRLIINILIIFLLFNALFCNAQQRIEVGTLIGVSKHFGDLTDKNLQFEDINPAFGAFFRFHFTDRLAIRTNLTFTKFSGTDLHNLNVDRGFQFNYGATEFLIDFDYKLFNLTRFNLSGDFRRSLSPYMSIGIGLVQTNGEPTMYNDKPNPFPEPDSRNTFIILPITAGIEWDFAEHFTLGVDAGWRTAFSDYLDGISQQAEPSKKDWYIIGGIHLSYWPESSIPNFNLGKRKKKFFGLF